MPYLLALDHALRRHCSLDSLDGSCLDVMVKSCALEATHEVNDRDRHESGHQQHEAHKHGPAWVWFLDCITLKEKGFG